MPVDRKGVLVSMARTLWVTEYMQELEGNESSEEEVLEYDEEAFPMAGSGEDWFYVAPETPPEMFEEAEACLYYFETNQEEVLEAWLVNDCGDPDGFGHYLVMQMRGHGVGLSEWFDKHGENDRGRTHAGYWEHPSGVAYNMIFGGDVGVV